MKHANINAFTTRTASRATFRLRCIDDLAEAVPYLLGFHPRRSIVLLGLTGGTEARPLGRVRVTVRLDTADLADDLGDDLADDAARRAGEATDGGRDPSDAARLAARTARSLRQGGAHQAVGVLFADADEDPSRCVQAMQLAGSACVDAGLDLLAFLVAPPQDEATAPGLVATEATYAGLVALPDRASLVSVLDPDSDDEREQHRAGVVEAIAAGRREVRAGRGASWHRSATRALHAASRTLTLAGDEPLLRFGAALTDPGFRESCWLAIEAGRLDGEGLWRELARRLPRPYDAAPLFFYGWIRWRAGDGALAGIAAQRALDSEPGYRAAALLAGALQSGLDPFSTPRLRKAG